VPDIRRCVVVGAGLLGLSAARSLSRRGWSVCVLEAAGGIGHSRAGSKGTARIFRLGYPDPLYVEMALAARDLWRTLEHESGQRLLHETGQLTLGDDAALAAIRNALTAHGARCDELTAEEARTRYPGIAATAAALVEPDSAVLAADEALRALYVTADAEVRTGTRVTGLDDAGDGVRVTTGDGELRADIVVACAGPDTIGLLGPAAPRVAAQTPTLPQVAYFRCAANQPCEIPVFIEWGDEMIYGLPVPGTRDVVKVSHHAPGPALEQYDPSGTTPFPDDPALLASLVRAVRRLLPALDPEPVAAERCVYDNSIDSDFILDRVGNVVIGCGTSGHGFKFGPLLGELLADLAEGTRPAVDLTRFRLARQ